MNLHLLLVEYDAGLRTAITLDLEDAGYEVEAVGSVKEAAHALQKRRVDLLLVDLKLPDGSGLDVLAVAKEIEPPPRSIVMTGFPEVGSAVEAMKRGAHDYVTKPLEPDDLVMTVQRAAESVKLTRRLEHFERTVQREGPKILEGDSRTMVELRARIERVAKVEVPVLILGETGVGKELVAESIHASSHRSSGPLVKVNCSAISDQLLESELFGHERGAFTDAKKARTGVFEMADGGTLFLDEIGEMRAGLQAKLLRVVEGQPFRRVGGSREIKTNTRVVAATNRDLREQVQIGEFREDLYFRLNVFPIEVPPLRERERDAVLLAKFFLARSGQKMHRPSVVLSEGAVEALAHYHWPGNVRELKNVVERALILADDGIITPEHLPSELQAESFVRRQSPAGEGALPTLDEVERRFIEFALEQTGGNISETARQLGIARNTLKRRLRLDSD
jgi:two-component system, NtrC family, response regulator AtoC